MSLRVNGFMKVGILSTMLAIGGTECKRSPYKPMAKEMVSPKMEHVVDSFYKEGLKFKNNVGYNLVHRDTISFKDSYIEDPGKLQKCFDEWENADRLPVEELNAGYLLYNDPRYIVSSNQIFTKDGKKAYIAIEDYDKKKVVRKPIYP